MAFHDKAGGFGPLAPIGRSGAMAHAEPRKRIPLSGRAILPRPRAVQDIEPA